jgi:DNA invertase Pin-like site-specific DNA recombinase
MHAIVFYCTLTAEENSTFAEGEPYATRNRLRTCLENGTTPRPPIRCLENLNEGDTLVVWKLDRLGRSLQQLIETLEKLKKRNIHGVSLTEDVNTSTPTGMLFFQLIAMLAEFEPNIISERTKAGLEAARARGRTGGRPKLKPDNIKIAIAKQLHASHSTKVKEICHTLHISKATLYRYLKM